MTKDEVKIKALDIASSQAVSWFNIHARQRLVLVNFYILIGVGITGFNITTDQNSSFLLVYSGVVLIVISVLFKLLDLRISFLIKCAENSLQSIQSLLAESIDMPEVSIIEHVDGKSQITFRVCFNLLFLMGLLTGVGFVLGFLYELL